MSLNLYTIDKEYVRKLRLLDSKVIDNSGEKEKRPFVGILLEVDNKSYLAPLASPKEKHLKMKNQIDFHKLNGGELGAINFNNMIPVNIKYINKIDPSKIEIYTDDDIKYINLLNNQLSWLNNKNNEKIILDKARKIRSKYILNKLPKMIKDRCVDFILLEANE